MTGELLEKSRRGGQRCNNLSGVARPNGGARRAAQIGVSLMAKRATDGVHSENESLESDGYLIFVSAGPPNMT
jgi:hypothetical protein